MIIYVQERSQTGATKRFSSTEVFSFLSTANVRTQLTNNIAVENLVPKTGLSVEQLKQYLDSPPHGQFTLSVQNCSNIQ